MSKKSAAIKNIAIIGGADSAKDMAREVAKLGMKPVILAAISFKRLKISPKGASALDRIDRFDWIFFTSRNAVSFFMKELKARRLALPQAIKIAAVGPGTAAALKQAGFRASFVPKRPSAEGLASELGRAVSGSRILFPRPALAPRKALASLRRNGARVTPLSLYATMPQGIPSRLLKQIEQGRIDCLVFTSPSAVHSFIKRIRDKNGMRSIPALCIGPTTAQAVRAARFDEIHVAKAPTAAGIASLLRSLS